MDLISLEIHIHLKIKGEHTQSKTYLWFGRSWNTHTVNWATVQQTHGSHVALGLHKAGRGFSHKQSILQLLEDSGVLSQGCGTEAMRKCSLGVSACLNHKDPTAVSLGEAPTLHPNFQCSGQELSRGVLFHQTQANTVPGAHLGFEKYSFLLCLWTYSFILLKF